MPLMSSTRRTRRSPVSFQRTASQGAAVRLRATFGLDRWGDAAVKKDSHADSKWQRSASGSTSPPAIESDRHGVQEGYTRNNVTVLAPPMLPA